MLCGTALGGWFSSTSPQLTQFGLLPLLALGHGGGRGALRLVQSKAEQPTQQQRGLRWVQVGRLVTCDEAGMEGWLMWGGGRLPSGQQGRAHATRSRFAPAASGFVSWIDGDFRWNGIVSGLRLGWKG